MFDFSKVTLPHVTIDKDGDVTTIHAIVSGQLICSYISDITNDAAAISWPVLNADLTPPNPILFLARQVVADRYDPQFSSFIQNVLDGDDDNTPAMLNAVAAVKAGLNLAQPLVESLSNLLSDPCGGTRAAARHALASFKALQS